jgi:hypothetical protein
VQSVEPHANISPRERFLSSVLIGGFFIEARHDASDFGVYARVAAMRLGWLRRVPRRPRPDPGPHPLRMLKSDSRNRSPVGRIACDFGPARFAQPAADDPHSAIPVGRHARP